MLVILNVVLEGASKITNKKLEKKLKQECYLHYHPKIVRYKSNHEKFIFLDYKTLIKNSKEDKNKNEYS